MQMPKLCSSAVFVIIMCQVSFLVKITSAEEGCSETVIQCIKNQNKGAFPVSMWTGLEVLWNRHYSIVWYSKHLVEEQKLECVTTKFGIFGNTDTYWHNCLNKENISFRTSTRNGVFTISGYQGKTLSAYPFYHKRNCLGLYVCSSEGGTEPHVTVYCRTSKLSESTGEIEEAKAVLSACDIKDGTQLCKNSCYKNLS